LNPELFLRVGIKPPKGVLLYGPPGTGKTLLARAVAATLQTNFLKVVSSAIVDKYIGESARVVREMFGYARDHEPCVIFMDEIDAIGGRRFSEGSSADREIQRTLMEVCLKCARVPGLPIDYYFLFSCLTKWMDLTPWAKRS
jgi:26S proteasome regulatory subunit T4